ncbi:unnamed protein product, partial [Trichogramma brassicae]
WTIGVVHFGRLSDGEVSQFSFVRIRSARFTPFAARMSNLLLIPRAQADLKSDFEALHNIIIHATRFLATSCQIRHPIMLRVIIKNNSLRVCVRACMPTSARWSDALKSFTAAKMCEPWYLHRGNDGAPPSRPHAKHNTFFYLFLSPLVGHTCIHLAAALKIRFMSQPSARTTATRRGCYQVYMHIRTSREQYVIHSRILETAEKRYFKYWSRSEVALHKTREKPRRMEGHLNGCRTRYARVVPIYRTLSPLPPRPASHRHERVRAHQKEKYNYYWLNAFETYSIVQTLKKNPFGMGSNLLLIVWCGARGRARAREKISCPRCVQLLRGHGALQLHSRYRRPRDNETTTTTRYTLYKRIHIGTRSIRASSVYTRERIRESLARDRLSRSESEVNVYTPRSLEGITLPRSFTSYLGQATGAAVCVFIYRSSCTARQQNETHCTVASLLYSSGDDRGSLCLHCDGGGTCLYRQTARAEAVL